MYLKDFVNITKFTDINIRRNNDIYKLQHLSSHYNVFKLCFPYAITLQRHYHTTTQCGVATSTKRGVYMYFSLQRRYVGSVSGPFFSEKRFSKIIYSIGIGLARNQRGHGAVTQRHEAAWQRRRVGV